MTFQLLCIYLIALLIRPQDFLYGQIFVNEPVILYLLVAILFSFFFSKHKSKNIFSPPLKILCCLMLVIAISSILNGWVGGVLVFLNKFSSIAILPFMLISSIVNTITKQKIIMLIMIFSVIVMMHEGLSQTLSEDGTGWAGGQLIQGNRISYLGSLGDPNDLGMFIVMTLPFIWYFYLSAGHKLAKLIYLGIMCLALYSIYLTGSRGAFLAVAGLLFYTGYKRYGVKKMLLLSCIIVPALLAVMTLFRSIEVDESAEGRIDAWYQGFQMLKLHPLFGVGMNNFTEYNHLTAHNSYVLVLAELGLFGYILWSIFIMINFIALAKVKNLQSEILALPDNEPSKSILIQEIAIANSLFYSLIGFMITAFFLSRSYSFLLYIYTGLAYACFSRVSTIFTGIKLKFSDYFLSMFFLSLLGIVGLYIVTSALL